MVRSYALRGALCLAGALLFLAAPAVAQTNAEMNAGIQFNFSTPGARSLGLGGAFVGLADDATAAYTNPAGLTILTKPEISIEGRQWDYTSTYTDSGHGYGDPTGTGIDTVAGFRDGSSSTDTTGLSFLSFVLPGEGWAIAAYRHEQANFQAKFSTQGAYFDAFDTLSNQIEPFRYFPVIAEMDLDIVNYGVSGSFRLSDKFSLGLGVSYYEFDMTGITYRHNFTDGSEDVGGYWGPPNYDPNNVVNYQTQDGSDTDYGFNVGFLYRATEGWSFGGVYRQGPKFNLATASVAGPGATENPPGTVFRAPAAEFNVPDVLALGVAYRPTDAVTLTFDWDRVEYSSLTESVANLFPESYDEATSRLKTDDANEFHLGFEYVFINLTNPIAVRLGGWYDPDHKIYYDGEPDESVQQRSIAGTFRRGDDVYHYSVGIGFIIGESFQIDAAADLSDTIDILSLSAVVRF